MGRLFAENVVPSPGFGVEPHGGLEFPGVEDRDAEVFEIPLVSIDDCNAMLDRGGRDLSVRGVDWAVHQLSPSFQNTPAVSNLLTHWKNTARELL